MTEYLSTLKKRVLYHVKVMITWVYHLVEHLDTFKGRSFYHPKIRCAQVFDWLGKVPKYFLEKGYFAMPRLGMLRYLAWSNVYVLFRERTFYHAKVKGTHYSTSRVPKYFQR